MCIEYIPRRAGGGHALGACVLIETQRVKKLSPDDAVRSNLGGKKSHITSSRCPADFNYINFIVIMII